MRRQSSLWRIFFRRDKCRILFWPEMGVSLGEACRGTKRLCRTIKKNILYHYIRLETSLKKLYTLIVWSFGKDWTFEKLLRIDNMAAIWYINRMGDVQFARLTAIARPIWQWCEQRNIWIFAYYVKWSENKGVEKDSGKLPGKIEGFLSQRYLLRRTE